ncbi:iron-containing alcohol dehydrogenase [Brachymonas denitrificans]|uniref:iron-containing alcohol dehydrogenase n=1 Tax=Brachymonas denitrificans TaxID=28220 RepID=UPI002AFFE16C|nr:iron-containing alcohol dehydrogenase [Brachymonas denitrificans]
MQNFDYQNPTRILFGQGSIAKLAKAVPASARVLLLYGGGSVLKNGTLDEVKAALATAGIGHVSEFSGIEPNPTFETLMRAVQQVKAEQIDFLLAVGGGSVIDGTKFVAAAAALPEGEDPWNILLTGGRVVKSALPFGSVLTLPATGSEMNNGGVITRAATHDKLPFSSRCTYPQFSVLDPTKTFTLPKRQVANGVVDAFVHITEQYLTYPANARVQDRFAEGLLRTLVEIGQDAVNKPEDYDTRANLMWTATLALNGLIGAGVPQDWATHMIGHELTALHGIDHARTLALVLPALLQVRREEKRAKLLQYAERVWDIRDGSENARIDQAIERTRAFFESLDVPTRLSAYQLDAAAIDPLVAQLEKHGMVKLGEKQDISLDVSRRILETAL